MKKCLITGITGQDGSYLSELMLEKGYEVHGIIRRSSSFNTDRINHIFDELKLYYGDLTDYANLCQIINKIKPDEIYNLGAQSHVKTSFEVPLYTSQTDAIGVLNLVDIIKNYLPTCKLYQASTSELYGLQKNIPKKGFNENTKFYPRSPYAVAKLYAYWIVKNYRESYDLFLSNGILFNHESPRRGGTFVTKKITDWIKRYLKNPNELPLQLGNIYSYRDWGHAKDYVKSMYMILQHEKPDDFVVSTGETYTVKDFIDKCFTCINKNIQWHGKGLNEYAVCDNKKVIEINKKYFRPAEVDYLLGDCSKIQKQLNWKPDYDLDKMIKEMIYE